MFQIVEKPFDSTAIFLSLANYSCKTPNFLIKQSKHGLFFLSLLLCHLCWNPLATHFLVALDGYTGGPRSQDIQDYMEIFKTSVFLSSQLDSMCQGLRLSQALALRTPNALTKAHPQGLGHTHSAMPR